MIRVARSCIHGRGLFARQAFRRGQTIVTLDIDYTRVLPNDYYGQFVNHSETPCCKVVGYHLVAVRDIQKNDELTCNYADVKISTHFES